MQIKFTITNYDLERGIVEINWDDRLFLAHEIPTGFTEDTTNEELLEYAKTIAPRQELMKVVEIKDDPVYSQRLAELLNIEWDMDLDDIPEPELVQTTGIIEVLI